MSNPEIVIDGKYTVTTYESGTVIRELTQAPVVPVVLKSVYTNEQFAAMIPANKLKQIRASIEDDIEYWAYMLPMLKIVDLNNLPVWFVAGLDAMVTDGILTQPQVDGFLEI